MDRQYLLVGNTILGAYHIGLHVISHIYYLFYYYQCYCLSYLFIFVLDTRKSIMSIDVDVFIHIKLAFSTAQSIKSNNISFYNIIIKYP